MLALDPGPVKTAFVVLTGDRVTRAGHVDNGQVLEMLAADTEVFGGRVVSESIECYGMAVGASTFETAFWIGRYWQAALANGCMFDLVKRSMVKLTLCRSARAKDAHIRQALIDRYETPEYPAVGRKAQPGPLYGVAGHAWSALAVGVTWNAMQLDDMQGQAHGQPAAV